MFAQYVFHHSLCPPIQNPLQPPSPPHPSGSPQCTGPGRRVSRIEPGLAICIAYDTIRVPGLLSQTVPPSPPPTEFMPLLFNGCLALCNLEAEPSFHCSAPDETVELSPSINACGVSRSVDASTAAWCPGSVRLCWPSLALPCSGRGPGGQPCAQSAGRGAPRAVYTRPTARCLRAPPACSLTPPERPLLDAAVLALFEFLHKSETFKNTNSILLECHSRILIGISYILIPKAIFLSPRWSLTVLSGVGSPRLGACPEPLARLSTLAGAPLTPGVRPCRGSLCSPLPASIPGSGPWAGLLNSSAPPPLLL